MTDARVARLVSLDGPDGIQIEREAVGDPGPGEVRLNMTALGLNRAEAMFARGTYPIEAVLPSRMGFEGVGVVAAVGDGVVDVEVGQRVGVFCALGMQELGTAADEVVMPASMLMPDLPSKSDTELAAFWVAYLTAYAGLVQTGRLVRDETVLITAASSSVGMAAIEIARGLGAKVVATTRTGAKTARLREAGADAVIVTNETAIADAGHPIDLAFDAVAGAGVQSIARALRPRGRLIVYGLLADDPRTPFPMIEAIGNDLSMRAFHLGYHVMTDESRRTDAVEWCRRRAAELHPVVDRELELAELADAYRYLEASQQIGKVVVRVER